MWRWNSNCYCNLIAVTTATIFSISNSGGSRGAAELELTRRELRRANDEVAEQREEAECQQGYAESLNSELETVQLRMELEKLRTIESK